MKRERADKPIDEIDECAAQLSGQTTAGLQAEGEPTTEDLVYWLEKLDNDTYKRVIRSSRLRRKGNEALNGSKNGK